MSTVLKSCKNCRNRSFYRLFIMLRWLFQKCWLIQTKKILRKACCNSELFLQFSIKKCYERASWYTLHKYFLHCIVTRHQIISISKHFKHFKLCDCVIAWYILNMKYLFCKAAYFKTVQNTKIASEEVQCFIYTAGSTSLRTFNHQCTCATTGTSEHHTCTGTHARTKYFYSGYRDGH